jgi:hypothetical protein
MFQDNGTFMSLHSDHDKENIILKLQNNKNNLQASKLKWRKTGQ